MIDVIHKLANKSLFSFLHQLSTWHCPHLLSSERRALAPLLSRAIDRYLLSAGPTAANPPAAAACGGCMLDRRTDVTQPSLILYSTV